MNGVFFPASGILAMVVLITFSMSHVVYLMVTTVTVVT